MERFAKILSLLLLVGLSACYDEEIYSDVPEITFESIRFINTPAQDSLILSFSFTDGDANIGWTPNDFAPQHLVFLDSNNYVVTENTIDTLTPPFFTAPIFLEEKFVPIGIVGNTIFTAEAETGYTVILLDTAFFTNDSGSIPFECPGLINQDGSQFDQDDIYTYGLTPAQNGQRDFVPIAQQAIQGVVPTVFVENYYNFIVIFEERIGDEYFEVNFQEIFGQSDCEIGNFNGQIPWFDPDGTSGTINYAMNSFGFVSAFQDKTIRGRFYVYDRAGNKSNEAVTQDFILSEITQ